MTKFLPAGATSSIPYTTTSSPSGTKSCAEAWKSIYAAEEALAKSKSANAAQGKSLVVDARKLATQVPINDKRASDKEVTGAFKSKSGLKAQLETEWENIVRGNYAKAKELANKAAALAR